MDVKAQITSYQIGDDGPQGKHRFGFEMSDSQDGPYPNYITLRTAQALTHELLLATAFGQMVAAIVETKEGHFEELIGRIFKRV